MVGAAAPGGTPGSFASLTIGLEQKEWVVGPGPGVGGCYFQTPFTLPIFVAPKRGDLPLSRER